MAYINLTNDLTYEGRRKIKLHQVLMFDYEGSPVYLKIMRKTKDGIWAKQLDPNLFLTPEDADEHIDVVNKKVKKS